MSATTGDTPLDTFSADDQREIEQLVFRYAYAVSRSDPDGLSAAWSANCRLELAGVSGTVKTIEGRDTVVAYQREHMGWYESLIQVVGQGLVWAGPDHVEGRWLVWEVGRRSNASSDRMGVVAYADRYVHEEDRWTIASRRLTVHYETLDLPTGTYVPLPALPI
jgi:hypothetical protein